MDSAVGKPNRHGSWPEFSLSNYSALPFPCFADVKDPGPVLVDAAATNFGEHSLGRLLKRLFG
jgi:hypothetical protein